MKRIFRAGDKVRVSHNPVDPIGPLCFVEDMNKYKGRIVTIARVVDRKKGWYNIKEDGVIYTWLDCWLEPLQAKKQKRVK